MALCETRLSCASNCGLTWDNSIIWRAPYSLVEPQSGQHSHFSIRRAGTTWTWNQASKHLVPSLIPYNVSNTVGSKPPSSTSIPYHYPILMAAAVKKKCAASLLLGCSLLAGIDHNSIILYVEDISKHPVQMTQRMDGGRAHFVCTRTRLCPSSVHRSHSRSRETFTPGLLYDRSVSRCNETAIEPIHLDSVCIP